MRSHKGKLVSIGGLSENKGIPVRTLRSLMAARKIPFFKLGHRTLLFDPDKVHKALQRFEVHEIGSRTRQGGGK